MVKFCPKCGSKLNDDDVFCIKCGYDMSDRTENNSKIINKGHKSLNNGESLFKTSIRNKKIIIIILAIIVLVLGTYNCTVLLGAGTVPFVPAIEVTGAFTQDSWTHQAKDLIDDAVGNSSFVNEYDNVVVLQCVAKQNLIQNDTSEYTNESYTSTMAIDSAVITFSDGTKTTTTTLLGDCVAMKIHKGESFILRTQYDGNGKKPVHISGNICRSNGEVIGSFDCDIQ